LDILATFGNSKDVEDYRRALAADELLSRIKPDDVRTLHGYRWIWNDIGQRSEVTDPRAALVNYEERWKSIAN